MEQWHLKKAAWQVAVLQFLIAKKLESLAQLYRQGLPTEQAERAVSSMRKTLQLLLADKLDLERQLGAHEGSDAGRPRPKLVLLEGGLAAS